MVAVGLRQLADAPLLLRIASIVVEVMHREHMYVVVVCMFSSAAATLAS